jgi:hypothetical protein
MTVAQETAGSAACNGNSQLARYTAIGKSIGTSGKNAMLKKKTAETLDATNFYNALPGLSDGFRKIINSFMP